MLADYQALVVVFHILSEKTDLVVQIEFTEWTPDGHLRHSKFVRLKEDKDRRTVVREEHSVTHSRNQNVLYERSPLLFESILS